MGHFPRVKGDKLENDKYLKNILSIFDWSHQTQIFFIILDAFLVGLTRKDLRDF